VVEEVLRLWNDDDGEEEASKKRRDKMDNKLSN
jgi:hypothetical protein